MNNVIKRRHFIEVHPNEDGPLPNDIFCGRQIQSPVTGCVLRLREVSELQIDTDLAKILEQERQDRNRELARKQDDMVAMARALNEARELLELAEHELNTLNGLTATDQPGAFDAIHSMRKWTIDTTACLAKLRKAIPPIPERSGVTRLAGAGIGGGCSEEGDMEGDEVEHVTPDNATRIGKAILEKFHDDAPFTVEKLLRGLSSLGYAPPRKGLAEWLTQHVGELRETNASATAKWKRAEKACERLALDVKAGDAMLDEAEAKLETLAIAAQGAVNESEAVKLHRDDLRLVLFHHVAENQTRAQKRSADVAEFFRNIK